MLKNNIQKNISQKGFTIVETLVAITILMISIAGPLTIANKSLMAAIYAKDQVTASFLAQDELERMKNDRDNKTANPNFTTWATNYNNANPCANSACDLGINTFDGRYEKYTNGVKTKFTRKGYVDTILSDHEVLIKVIVQWDNGRNSVTLTDDLFDVSL